MTWQIEFVAPNKAAAIEALMHPRVALSRGLPVAVREQVVTMIEMLTDADSAAFVYVKTSGHLSGERSVGSVNMKIEVNVVQSYVVPASDLG